MRLMTEDPDPGFLTGPAHLPQVAAAKQAEAARLAAEAKEAREAKEKVRLLVVVLVHVSRVWRRLPGRGGLVPLSVGLQGDGTWWRLAGGQSGFGWPHAGAED